MVQYIAELDESQEICAVWVKEKSARGPYVFDPQKHILNPKTVSGYSGAQKEKIEEWISKSLQRSRTQYYGLGHLSE